MLRQLGTNTASLGTAFAASLTATAVKTSAYTAAAGDLIPVDATPGAVTITLPTAPAARTRVAIKKIDSSTNAVTIARGGSSDVFNKAAGSTSLTLVLTNQAVSLQYSGGIWYVVGDDLPLSGLDARYTNLVSSAQRWAASTTYAASDIVLDPNGSLVKAKAAFTTTTTYNAANWTPVEVAPVLAPFAWDFMHKLETDVSNVVLAISGDSVSDGANDWVALFVGLIAARFPKYTVTLKLKTAGASTYDSDITVQTGAGGNGHTLTVYNWSQSGAGSTVGYDTNTTLEIAYPVAPDLFLIATGHNDDVNTVTKQRNLARVVRQGIDRIMSYYPDTTVAMVLMNPEAAADANYLNKFTAEETKVAIASDLGLGVMNLERAWLDLPGGYASLLADTKHPTVGPALTSGMGFLATTAYAHFASARSGPTAVRKRRRSAADQLYVPLLGGYAFTGSPTPTVQATYANTVGIAFDSVADESWMFGPIELPYWWQGISVEVDWAPQTNNSGNVYFELRYIALVPDSGTGTVLMGTTAVAGPASKVGKMQTSTLIGTSPAFTIPSSSHTNAKTTGGNYPMLLKLSRLASNVLDTLESTDALVYGLRFIRYQ